MTGIYYSGRQSPMEPSLILSHGYPYIINPEKEVAMNFGA